MMKNKGLLVIITGCSGVGKGTIVRELLKRDENNRLSVSATTRAPRPGETDGEHYFFMTRAQFEDLKNANGFLEHAEFCENYYGTPKKAVDDMIADGKNVILEIEVQGGAQVKRLRPDSISIFILPPSFEELENRLRGRGTEDEETIQRRLAASEAELKIASSYDYRVVNDDLESAITQVLNIIHTEREKREV